MKNWNWFHDHFSPSEIHLHGYSESISSLTTDFQAIEIIRSPVYGKMVIIDGDVQSTERDEYIYHETLVHPAFIAHPNPETIYLAGGGEGATLREILKHKSVKSVIKCDIDVKAIQLFMEVLPEWHQNSFFDNRVTLLHEDARVNLENQKNNSFDIIVSDLTEPTEGGPSQKLFSNEFFKICYQKLKPDGFICLQASLLQINSYEMHASILKTMQETFPIVRSLITFVPSFDTTWGFAIGSKSIDPLDIVPGEINKRIEERLTSKTKFYDGISHGSLFSISKDIGSLLSANGRVIEDNKPFTLKKKKDIV